MRILFICTSNADRSPALQKYFSDKYPDHAFISAGINRYHTKKKGTHWLTKDDIFNSDLVVFAEPIHKTIVSKGGWEFQHYMNNFNGKAMVLGLGKYEKGNVNEDYLKRADDKLRDILTKPLPI